MTPTQKALAAAGMKESDLASPDDEIRNAAWDVICRPVSSEIPDPSPSVMDWTDHDRETGKLFRFPKM